MNIRRYWHACLPALLVFISQAAAADLYADINRLREGGGSCGAGGVAALKPRPALEQAARALSRGEGFKASLRHAGYRPARAVYISLKGQGAAATAAAVLAGKGYCAKLRDAVMTDVGVYQDVRQVWVVLAAPFAPAVALTQQAAGLRILELVNQARATARRCGQQPFGPVSALRWNEQLAAAARGHAADMASHDYFSHAGRDGANPGQRVERAGYRYRMMGENIAAGQTGAEEAVAGWIKSPEHCANLMQPAFTDMGAGYAVNVDSSMGIYWAQEFGRPR